MKGMNKKSWKKQTKIKCKFLVWEITIIYSSKDAWTMYFEPFFFSICKEIGLVFSMFFPFKTSFAVFFIFYWNEKTPIAWL